MKGFTGGIFLLTMKARLILFLLSMIGSFAASASPAMPENIAFPLDGVLVQRIPERNKALFKPEETFTISHQGRSYFYVYRPETQRILAKLKKDGVNLIVYTWESQDFAQSMAKSMKLPDLGGASLADVATVLGGERKSSDLFNEANLGVPVEKSLFVASQSTKMTPVLSNNAYQTGSVFYAFPTFKKAQEAAAWDASTFIPRTESAWFTERNKIIIFYAHLRMAADSSATREQFFQKLKALQDSAEKESFVRAGLEILSGGSALESSAWTFEVLPSGRKEITGCDAVERLNKSRARPVDRSECEKNESLEHRLVESDGAVQCWVVVRTDLYLRRESRIEPCLSKTDQVQFLLSNPARPVCGAYLKNFTHIQDVNPKFCKQSYVIFDPANRKGYVYEAFAGFESLSESALLEKAKAFGSGPFVCLEVPQALDRVCARDVENDEQCGGVGRYAFIRESCLIGDKNELIPEIVQVKYKGAVPPSVYSEYSPEKIALSLIYRRFQNFERPLLKEDDVIHPAYPLYANQFPMMAFNLKNLPLILREGFRNLHQTGEGNGLRNTAWRAEVENFLLGVDLEKTRSGDRAAVVHRVRPKYAFGMFARPFATLEPGTVSDYGEFLTLFKSRVRRRMTVSSGDSLNNYRNARFQLMTMYSSAAVFQFERLGFYYENQIWGDLTTDDIDGFLAECPGHSGRASDLIQVLKAQNSDLPVYECVDASQGDGFKLFKKGKLLYGAPTSP